jgi:acylphosphatase
VAAYQYVVQGRVQGVGYRYFALREAEALGVNGFARNRPDGSVEVLAEGPEEALARFEEKLRTGPAFSRVEGVARTAVTPREAEGFYVR